MWSVLITAIIQVVYEGINWFFLNKGVLYKTDVWYCNEYMKMHEDFFADIRFRQASGVIITTLIPLINLIRAVILILIISASIIAYKHIDSKSTNMKNFTGHIESHLVFYYDRILDRMKYEDDKDVMMRAVRYIVDNEVK